MKSGAKSADETWRHRMNGSSEENTWLDVELSQLAGHGDDLGARSPKDKPCGQEQSNLSGEWPNIALLLLLYTLQGVPMGLSGVLPMVLKERGASFSDLGTFSLNSWPFALKLLWAPIVDTAYVRSIGRRKTWMVPAQLSIGLVMIILSMWLDDLLYGGKPAIRTLTIFFFVLFFLCATQDIAVDGWALTMLRKENVAYAATCNSVGQTLGYTLGFTGFMVLEHFKLSSLASFMFGWGLIFITITLAVAIFKAEKPVPPEDEPEDVAAAYGQMMAMLRMPAIRSLVLVLFTWKAGFGIEGALVPKFQEHGVPKEHLAYMTTLIMPVYIVLPIIVSGWTAGATPLDVGLKAYPLRVLLLPCFAIAACLTPTVFSPLPWGFYMLMFVLSLLAAVVNQCMFVSQMSFFARVSDPAMGGTYMTLLNTLGNLGGMWPSTTTMFLIDSTSCKGDTCMFERDGFYVMTAVSAVIGATWYYAGSDSARRLQHQKESSWSVR